LDKLTPKAIIFDFGSTLVEYPSTTWEEVNVECVENTRLWLIKQGREIPDEATYYGKFQAIRESLQDTAARSLVEWTVPQVAGRVLDEFGVEYDEAFIDEFFDAYYENIAKYLYAVDDVVEVLEKIRSRYAVVGLVSNTVFPPRAHIAEMERFGLAGFFDFKIFSSTFGVRKPHPAIFYEAANLAGFAPGECVYIGDRYLEDVQGPTEIGMPAILKVHKDREYPPDMSYNIRKINNLPELDSHFEF